MKKLVDTARKRLKRKASIRKKLSGTAERPRLTVYKSNRRTYVQAVDDVAGATLASASNLEKEARASANKVADMESLGLRVAERLKARKITAAVFDRNGYKYHGKVKAIADGARKAGIQL
ncbi:MAG: 50S ribosomal protein L18 [Spirochaetes bacterium]|nr:50S ribosomal protein L18 [Spirochaetota bacterium]